MKYLQKYNIFIFKKINLMYFYIKRDTITDKSVIYLFSTKQLTRYEHFLTVNDVLICQCRIWKIFQIKYLHC